MEILAFLLLLLRCSQAQKVLNYAIFTASEVFDSSGAVPAIKLAESMVNKDNSTLPGYTLQHTDVKDTECNRAKSLTLFFEALSPSRPPILGLLGSGCSVASTPLAEIVQHQGLSQISYASSSVELDDQERFPNFFRTYPSDAEFPAVFSGVLLEYDWNRVGVLTQNEGIFTEVFERLKQPLAAQNISMENRIFRNEIPIQGLNDSSANVFFEDDDYHVFFVNGYFSFAQHIICEAYKRGFTYPRYAWVLYAWYAEEWWTTDTASGCTTSQLADFLDKSIAIQIFAVPSDENAPTETGLTASEFVSHYESLLRDSNYTSSYLASIGYDALWSFAFALDKTSRMLEEVEREEILAQTGCSGVNKLTGRPWELVHLENFTNNNQLLSCIIHWNLQRTDFIGVSGRVQFNEVGSRFQARSQIFQYRMNQSEGMQLELECIAQTEYRNSSNTSTIVYLGNESSATVYPDGVPPDGTPIDRVNTFHTALVACYCILAGLGIVYSTVCLVFNFAMRKKRIVKLTSPNLNYFLIAGTYIMYVSVFLQLVPSRGYSINYARCITDVLVNTIGYCMAFGVILSKMGRINYIFNNPTTNKMTVKDWHLILVTLIITGIGTLLVVLQVAIPPFRPVPQLIADDEYGAPRDELGVRINNTVYNCFSGARPEAMWWTVVTFVYLGLLQIVGLVLAIQTRKVKVKVLNDSKYIAALIYISSIALITKAVAVFGVNNLLNAREAILSGGIIVVSTAFLSFVFIPKMVSLARDMDGEKIFSVSKHHGEMSQTTSLSMVTISEQASKVQQLETKIALLEKQLELQKRENTNGTVSETLSAYIVPNDEALTI